MERILLLLVILLAPAALAAPVAPPQFLVLGVIAMGDTEDGVALLKNMAGGQTFAVRAGQEIAPQVVVRGITREYVYLRIGERVEKVKVGDQLDTTVGSAAPLFDAQAGGIERTGNVVRVTAAFRDNLKGQLNKVLMQAAAVPYYVNGELQGFRLWDIDQGSIYDRAGLADGDIVTAINGQALTDVGNTIKVLQTLKSETKAEVTFVRKGAEQTLQLLVQ